MRIYVFNWNNVLTDLAEELKKEHEVDLKFGGTKGLDWKKYDLFLMWNEVGDWGEFVQKVQKKGKKAILFQHGRRGTSRIHPPFNERLNSDLVCVWGEADRRRLISANIPAEKIRVTGTTIFNNLKGRKEHEGKNVVFSPEHWCSEVAENAIVAGQLRRVKDIKITTKGLQGEHDERMYDNVVFSQRNASDHFEIVSEVLSTADVVVGISESTFELLAESLDIPVVIADIWMPKACGEDERYKGYQREYSEGCLRIKDPLKLPKAIKQALKRPNKMKEERKRAVIADGGIDIENPLQKMLDAVNELCS